MEDRKERTIKFNYTNPDHIIPICEKIGQESGNSAPFEIWQHNATDKSVILTFKNKHLFEKRMQEPSMTFQGSKINFFPFTQYPLPVRVKGIPIDMKEEVIKDIFGIYGGVTNVKECRGRILNCKYLDGIPNGDKWVILNIKNPVARFVESRGLRFACYYHGQPPTCVYCRCVGHNADLCPKLLCELCNVQGHN